MARRLKGRPCLTRVLVTAKKQGGGIYQTHRSLNVRPRARLRQHAPRAWELLEKTPIPKPRIKKPLSGGER